MTGSSTTWNRAAVGALTILLPVLFACHAYSGVEGVPDVGRTVEVTVDTARWRAPVAGGNQTLTGRVVSSSRDSVLLSVSSNQLRASAAVRTDEDTVAFPYGAAERIRYRSISAWKSAAVAAGVVAATAITFEVAASGGGVSGGDPGPGGPDESIWIRVPLFNP